MHIRDFRAAILDMDGVVTQTARQHARAWKEMFDGFLRTGASEDGSLEAFDIESDYRRYVDGKPRYDGVRSFLDARGLALPDGDPDDPSEKETVCGLGNRKNQIFLKLLEVEGVALWEDTVEQLEQWRREGWKTAVFSSSRNCEAVLRAGDALGFFAAKVDGNDLERLDLAGKPAPDMLLHAAALLGEEPARVVVLEDSLAGVRAGRAGGFGLVVGVARNRKAGALRRAGAHWVVQDVRELHSARFCPPGENCLQRPSAAQRHAEWLASCCANKRLALFLDYDGTLTPIVRRPEDATLSGEMRSLLEALARYGTVAIVSGRDRRDAEAMVDVPRLVYAGSHGFDIRGPGGLEMQQEDARRALPALDEAEQALVSRIASIPKARVERKRFAIAVHYREVEDDDAVRQVEREVDDVLAGHPGLRKRVGKRVFELQPDVAWDKGEALLWLLDALGLDRDSSAVFYIGDDVTDEDAFRSLRRRGIGIGIRVGEAGEETDALFVLRDCREVQDFLASLRDRLSEQPFENA